MRIDSAEFVRSAASRQELIQDHLPEIAFVGRSNVGKSSLLNRLLARKSLARTNSTPGRTRVVNYFLINGEFYFVDLPGYGWARAAKSEREAWGVLVDAYLGLPSTRRQVVHLIDAKVGATSLDLDAGRYLRETGLPVTPVATKVDQVPASRRRQALAAIRTSLRLADGTPIVAFSARTGEGIKELWREIRSHL